jgi:RimJ/RimL family protein N-acetyltransferase
MPGTEFIQGDTVDLCVIEEEDIPFLERGWNHPEINKYSLDQPKSSAEIREQVQSGSSNKIELLIVPKDAEDPIGYIQLAPLNWERRSTQLGIWVLPEEQRSRYGIEATIQIVDYAFEKQGFRRIGVETLEANTAVAEGVKKLGFEQTGRHREAAFFDGEWVDILLYDLLRSEWDGGEGIL